MKQLYKDRDDIIIKGGNIFNCGCNTMDVDIGYKIDVNKYDVYCSPINERCITMTSEIIKPDMIRFKILEPLNYSFQFRYEIVERR